MFHERGWLLRNPFVWILIPIVAVALAAGFSDPGARWFLPIPTVLLALLFAANLRIDVDRERLRLTYFPLWRRTIPLAAVIAAEIVPYRWFRYGGWGIRFGFDGSISYSVWEKQAVRVTLAHGKRPVNIGTRRPQELLDALLQGARDPKAAGRSASRRIKGAGGPEEPRLPEDVQDDQRQGHSPQ